LKLAVAAGKKVMRVFMLSCLAAAIIAVGAATVLDRFVQESSVAFTESSARIN
jgi:hypothetical protein